MALQRETVLSKTSFKNIFQNKAHKHMSTFYNLAMNTIGGETMDFSAYKDTLCLVVNVASR